MKLGVVDFNDVINEKQVTCKEGTKEIVLNAKDLKITKESVKVKWVSENTERNIDILDPYEILEAEQYVIPVTAELVAEQQYEIHISFSKYFSHDFNVYQFHSVIDAPQSDSKE